MKKIFLPVFLVFTSLFLSAAPKEKTEVNYDDFIRNSSLKELSDAVAKNSKILKKTVGTSEENLLLCAIRNDRPEEIISFLIGKKISPSATNNRNQDALVYVCIYSSDNPLAASAVIKQYGNKKTLTKALLKQDKEKKTALDYILENSNTAVYNIIARIADARIIQKYRPNTEPMEVRIRKSDPYDEQPAIQENPEIQETERTEPEEEPSSTEEPEHEASMHEELPESETDEADSTQKAPVQEEPDSENKKNVEEYKKLFLYDYEPAQKETFPEKTSSGATELAVIANPNKRDSKGRTALMTAVKAGNDWEVRSLLKSGADINLQDFEGWTAFMYAVRYQNNLDLMNLLLQNGADSSIKSRYGTNSLQLAAEFSNNPEILKTILNEYPAGSNEIFKAFILSITSNNGSAETQLAKIKVFIERNVSINRFYEGKTPLMHAAEYCTSTKILELLIDNGAITTMRDANGRTAFDYASMNSKIAHDDIYWALNSH